MTEHNLPTETTPEVLRVRLFGGGAGDGMILQLTELPMDLYVQKNVGASPFYLRGEVRVAVQVEMPYHRYRRWFDGLEAGGFYCLYRYMDMVREPIFDGDGWAASTK